MTKQIIDLIEKYEKIALFHHLKIDGDSLSSSYGLMKALQKRYPNKTFKWVSEDDFIKARFPKLDIDLSDSIYEIDEEWLAIVGDVSDTERVYKGPELLHKAGARVCFDHHGNMCSIENVDIFWHEPTWPASALQAYEIAKASGVEFDSYTALMLHYGIVTDTGRYAYSLTNREAMKASYELFEFIKNDDLQKVYESIQMRSEKDVKYQSHVLNNFKIEEGVAFFTVNREEQEKMGLTPDDCARVNLIGSIEGVEVWLFFIEYPDFIRVEYRSRGVHVNEIAKSFGGGGHIKAAGCHVDKMEKHEEIVKACQKAVAEFVA